MSALVVGGGPVGMTVAGLLARQGYPVTVIDKRSSLSTLPRGIAVNQASLAVFDQLEIGGDLDRLSLRVPRITLYRERSPIGQVDFSRLNIARPFFCHITQNVLERVLQGQLSRLGVTIQHGVALQSLTDTPTGVRAICIDADGRPLAFNADILLACDGGNSTVRSLLGLEVDQQTYGASFFLADVRFEQLPLCASDTHYFLCRSGYLMVVPIPQGRHRVILSFKGDGSATGIDARWLEAAIAQRVGLSVRIGEVCWSTHSLFGHRVCRRARCNQVFLAGDALHQFSPIGGTNMNVGIDDAAALARAILQGKTDDYEAQRLEVVSQHLRVTRYLTRVLVRTRELGPLRRPFSSRSLRCLLEDEIPPLLTGRERHPTA